ncbi:MAG: isoleucine--tRNA ligase [Alphaproteobacteria bacterium]
MSVDYKDTVFLPRTDFPMRGRLPQKEPELIERWRRIDVFTRQREDSTGLEKFILHDGPPYANGHLHIGHALNKILKDVVSRSQQMLGKDSHYVPGWDCHGLPIEWKVEEAHRAAGRNKDVVPLIEFRRECREFADKWIGVQSEEFQRLGVIGDWQRPYTTMSYPAEAQIAREIAKFAMSGSLYRGARPVLWSVVERTALADAEVEYHDHTSPSIYVRFPVARPGDPGLDGTSVLIWTTTPWTIPGNRGIAFHRARTYSVHRVASVREDSLARPGERLVLADELVGAVREVAGIEELVRLGPARGLEKTICAHPLRGRGYDFDVPLFHADFVTVDQGTGFVHVAPGHGEDDYRAGIEHGLEIPRTVEEDGSYHDHVPLFAGRRVLTEDGKLGEADRAVTEALGDAGALIGRQRLTHNYPHSWRSKAPLIFRNTTQWFISMEANDLRRKALDAIAETRFVPPQGGARLASMIETRPDWCISRQRAWGVPIPVFVHNESGEILRDQGVFDRVAGVFEEEGGDAWFTSPPSRFLGDDYDPADYEQVRDIVEVWFESGSTHAFVLEEREDLRWPASLYLEGSDQHRGWFHSSLLESCGTRGRAPYDAVLTHGFVLDEQGRKMSKSLGNVVSPQKVVEQYGADILRIWVVASDYSEDLRIGPEILKHQADLYRRIRNTFRFLLGNLDGFDEGERVAVADMPELERWVLHRLWQLDGVLRRSVDDFQFHTLWTALHNFCAVDLSAFYFDVRKDTLYCDALGDPKRRACRTVLDHLFDCLTAWLAPILCFTAEEVWLTRTGEADGNSVHLRTFPEVPGSWRDDALAAKWDQVRRVRRVITGALEIERAGKSIGSSLEAAPEVSAGPAYAPAMEGVDLAEIAITSAASARIGPVPEGAFTVEEVPDVGVVFTKALGTKCIRCYQIRADVGQHGHPDICGRCARVVDGLAMAED